MMSAPMWDKGIGNLLDGRYAQMAAVAVFAAFMACAGLFALPPLDRDESRFAQATAQMLESGDFVTIRFQQAERNKKPAGIYWLQAASVEAFSSASAREIWAYRLPSVIALMAATVLTYLAGARMFGGNVGFLGALLLAATPLAAAEATIAKTDAALLACVAAAQCAFVHIFARAREGRPPGWLLPIGFWTALGAGVLIKGPVAPLILLLTAVFVGIRFRDRAWAPALRPVAGLVIMTAMVAPWLFAINASTEGRFFAEALGRDMAGKIGAAQESHGGPPGFHLALAPLLIWPAIALLPPALMEAFRERRAWPFLLLLCWIVPAWIVFELTATKLPHYVLPLYPALCLLAAQAALSNTAATRPVARMAGAAIYGLVGLVFAAALVVLPTIYGADRSAPPASIVAAAVIGCGAIGVAALFWRGRSRRASFAAVALSAVFAWALLHMTPPYLQRLDVSRAISNALDAAGFHPLRDGAPAVVLAGYREPSAIFLLGTETLLGDGEDAAARLATAPGSAAVVEAQEDARFLAAVAARGLAPRRLAVIDGVNYSKGDTVRLTLYAIAR